MPTQTQNKTSILCKTVILWWGCVIIVDVENCTQSECVPLSVTNHHAKRICIVILLYFL